MGEPGRAGGQPSFGVGVAALAVVAALFGGLVLAGDGGHPSEDRPAAAETTTTGTAALPPGTFTLNDDEAARAFMVVYEPYVEQNKAEMAVVDIDGVELDRIPANGWGVIHRDRGVDLNTVHADGSYTAEAAPEFEDPVPGCESVHSAGGLRAAVCPELKVGGGAEEIRLVAPGGEISVLSGPVHPNAGAWRYAFPSPDGKWVLAQWSGECEVPVAYLFEVATGRRSSVRAGDEDSFALGWTDDGQAVVGMPGTGCGTDQDEGTFLLTPGTGERQRIHPFSSGALVADVQGWRFNRLERVVDRALDELGLEQCCAEPSHGGPVANTGMVVDGYEIFVSAVPLDLEVGKETSSPEVTFACGQARYRLADGSYDHHPDQETVERAVDLLVSRLYCQPSRPPRPAPPTIRVAGEAVRGTEVTLVAGQLPHALKSASVVLQAVDDTASLIMASGKIGADGTFRARFPLTRVLPHEGPCPTPQPCDLYPVQPGPLLARLVLDDPGGVFLGVVLGEVRFDVVPARMGVAYRSAMFDECGPARVEFDGRTWVLRPTAAIAPLEKGTVKGNIRVVDDAHAVFDPDGMERLALVPSDQVTPAETKEKPTAAGARRWALADPPEAGGCYSCCRTMVWAPTRVFTVREPSFGCSVETTWPSIDSW